MSSIGVKLPLTQDSADGFTMIKSIKDMVKQNFKMLLLTSPGERVMEPNFGVGLKTYLFASATEDIQAQIGTKIREQTFLYLPIIKIRNIQFGLSDIDTNTLAMRIIYEIPSIGLQDLIEFTI
jgi:phage baseplate assembly protein W